MANKTKRIDVSFMLHYANTQLDRTDEYATRDFKAGICVMIERILFETGNYNGFSHNSDEPQNTDSKEYYSRSYSKHTNLY